MSNNNGKDGEEVVRLRVREFLIDEDALGGLLWNPVLERVGIMTYQFGTRAAQIIAALSGKRV